MSDTNSVAAWREKDADTLAADAQSILDRAAASDLNSYVTVTSDKAQAQLAEAKDRVAKGERRALEGVPISVKDNFCTKGVLSTGGSNILNNFVPDYESHVTQQLWDAGAVCVGKTNMDEFGMGSSTENSHYGVTQNPWGRHLGISDLAPGGSSGGAAASVAAGEAVAALGTDTGGSIRQPSSFCGVVGMKPTYGRVSRWGVMAYGSSLDQAGVIARSVADVASVIDVINTPDDRDSTCYTDERDSLEAASKERKDLRIGVPKKFRDMSNSEDLEAVWNALDDKAKAIGAEIVPVDIPHIDYALPCYYIIATSEVSSNMSRYDGVRYGHRAENYDDIIDMYEKTRAEGFGIETKRRIMTGTFALSAGYYDQYYNKARAVRALIAKEFNAALEGVDLLAWPTAPSEAFTFGSHAADPVSMYLEDVFTVPVNLVGAPALSLPICKGSKGLPMGLQLVGAQKDDAGVVRASAMLEEAIGFEGLGL